VTKRSEFERRKRADAAERLAEIERAWRGSVPAEVAERFWATAISPADGTAPNPPRPGHEPKPPKAESRPRRGR
jgi:hypothetical protein